jgi:tetratricopeptide (TPR) repeat protein
MRRTLLIVGLVGAAGVALALGYSTYATEREFDRLLAEGDAAVQADRLFQGLEAYSGAIALNPEAMAPYLKRGSVYRAQGEVEAALRDLRQAAALDPTATRPLEWLGDLSLEMGRFDRAVEYYQRYLALDDRNAGILYRLGVARYRRGTVAEAVSALDRALAIDAGLADAVFLRGLCERDLGRLDQARTTLEAVVRRAPAEAGPREALAEVYGALGDERRTIDQLEALAALEPTRPERAVAAALAQWAAGREDQAILALGRALERFPESPLVFAALGKVWLEQAQARGDRVALIKAVEALTQASTHPSNTSEALTDLGRAWRMAGDPTAAERALRQAVTRLPAPPEAFLELASVTESQGRVQEARNALLQYAALVADRESIASVGVRIAALSMRIGEPNLAVRWLERVLDESGPTPALLARLADAAWSAGDESRARALVDEGLRLAPDDRALLSLRRRVGEDPARPAGRLPGN